MEQAPVGSSARLVPVGRKAKDAEATKSARDKARQVYARSIPPYRAQVQAEGKDAAAQKKTGGSGMKPCPSAPAVDVHSLAREVRSAPRFGMNGKALILQAAATASSRADPASSGKQGPIVKKPAFKLQPAPAVATWKADELSSLIPAQEQPVVTYVPRSNIPRLLRQNGLTTLLGLYLVHVLELLKVHDKATGMKMVREDAGLLKAASMAATTHELSLYRKVTSKQAYSQLLVGIKCHADMLPPTELDALRERHAAAAGSTQHALAPSLLANDGVRELNTGADHFAGAGPALQATLATTEPNGGRVKAAKKRKRHGDEDLFGSDDDGEEEEEEEDEWMAEDRITLAEDQLDARHQQDQQRMEDVGTLSGQQHGPCIIGHHYSEECANAADAAVGIEGVTGVLHLAESEAPGCTGQDSSQQQQQQQQQADGTSGLVLEGPSALALPQQQQQQSDNQGLACEDASGLQPGGSSSELVPRSETSSRGSQTAVVTLAEGEGQVQATTRAEGSEGEGQVQATTLAEGSDGLRHVQATALAEGSEGEGQVLATALADGSQGEGQVQDSVGPSTMDHDQQQPPQEQVTAAAGALPPGGVARSRSNGHKRQALSDVDTDVQTTKPQGHHHVGKVKFQVTEFVKAVLEPMYRAGLISKEIHKTVVRSAVGKILERHVPKDHLDGSTDFLIVEAESIRRFISKLVMYEKSLQSSAAATGQEGTIQESSAAATEQPGTMQDALDAPCPQLPS